MSVTLLPARRRLGDGFMIEASVPILAFAEESSIMIQFAVSNSTLSMSVSFMQSLYPI